MRNRIVKQALLLAVCVPTLALAQHPPQPLRGKGTWEFSAGGGIRMADNALSSYLASGFDANLFTADRDPGRFMPAVAVRLGYNFTRQLGFSLGGDIADGSGVTYVTPIAAFTYTGNLNEKTSPFITLGNQITRIVGRNQRRTHPTWGAHLGVGFRHMVSNNTALRVDGRMASEHYAELPGKKTAYPGTVTIGLSHFLRRGRPAPLTTNGSGQAVP